MDLQRADLSSAMTVTAAALLSTLLLAGCVCPSASAACAGATGGGQPDWHKPGYCGHMDCPVFTMQQKSFDFQQRRYKEGEQGVGGIHLNAAQQLWSLLPTLVPPRSPGLPSSKTDTPFSPTLPTCSRLGGHQCVGCQVQASCQAGSACALRVGAQGCTAPLLRCSAVQRCMACLAFPSSTPPHHPASQLLQGYFFGATRASTCPPNTSLSHPIVPHSHPTPCPCKKLLWSYFFGANHESLRMKETVPLAVHYRYVHGWWLGWVWGRAHEGDHSARCALQVRQPRDLIPLGAVGMGGGAKGCYTTLWVHYAALCCAMLRCPALHCAAATLRFSMQIRPTPGD